MIDDFRTLVRWMINNLTDQQIKNTADYSNYGEADDEAETAARLNSAFLVALAEDESLNWKNAREFLSRMKKTEKWGDVSHFYLKGLESLPKEINSRSLSDSHFQKNMNNLIQLIKDDDPGVYSYEIREAFWSLFFPEGCGIFLNKEEKRNILRKKRMIEISSLNDAPVTEPVKQVLFTSNVLLTNPSSKIELNDLKIKEDLRHKIRKVINEKQDYWYDHPVQIGVEPENNEFLYGLKGLEEAIQFERERNNLSGNDKLSCLLSVSVTHNGLHEIARPYLEDVIGRSRGIENIDIFVFTETDTRAILSEVLVPAATRFLNREASDLFKIVGVDGEYGRHYSFLKAAALLWNLLIDENVKATFKIDLDQVFPQKELLEETGQTAFEHLTSDMWGAKGTDFSGRPVELDMIAGALVNDSDIDKGLFTPDVKYPSEKGMGADELFFFSPLPQALSTEAEMMTRYHEDDIDGINKCIERIHVTGGTNGILIDSLKKYRPFTPSFIGRAEDQAYLFSTVFNRRERLAYVHKDGLFMRHDKESFAQEAIKSAHVSKIIGDYIRILYFSAYAHAITNDLKQLKDLLDPFTGCFISRLPLSVVYLRFSLKAMEMIKEAKGRDMLEFICTGAGRITSAIDFTSEDGDKLKTQYEIERKAWKLFYDTLSALEDALAEKDDFALELKKRAREITSRCHLEIKS
ncbi:hypothetical protein ACFL6W_09905 [Thermodesulfobacteriota bacterium]